MTADKDRDSKSGAGEERGRERRYRWTGLQHDQMPHESVFSACTRFCYLNGLNTRQAISMFRTRPYKTSELFGWSLDLDASKLESETGWVITDAQIKTTRTHPNVSNVLFADFFKVCYGCLAEGFHSTWHQFRLLSHCPIHNQQLATQCVTCGVNLSHNLLTQNFVLADSPLLRCWSCGHAPAFRTFSLERYMSFRKTADVENAFRPLQEWWTEASEAFDLIEKMTHMNHLRAWAAWGDAKHFLLSLLDRFCALPDCVDKQNLVQVSMQEWKQRHPPEQRRDIALSNSYCLESSAMYSVVLRSLHYWIHGCDTPDQVRQDLVELFSAEGLSTQRRKNKEVALVLFRAWYEMFIQPQSNWSDPRRIVLNERFPTSRLGKIITRKAQWAFLHASFAVIERLVCVRKSPIYFAKEFVDDEIRLALLIPVMMRPSRRADEREELYVGHTLYIQPEW